MKTSDIIIEDVEPNYVVETKMVWARKGKSVGRKFRCTFGKRKGRVVSNPSQCSAPVDQKKRFTLRRTKAQKGSRMTRKAQRTKRTNSASKMVRALNK
jgi:hypothetical protein